MCRRKLSFTAAEIRLIAFGTNLLQHRVRCRSGQGMPDPKHPHAMFPCEGPGPTHGTQSYLFADCLHIKSVARFQVQLLAEGFWNHHTTGLIDGQANVHHGMVRWVDPTVNAICDLLRPPV